MSNMELLPYKDESEYDSAKVAKSIKIKLARTALLSRKDIF